MRYVIEAGGPFPGPDERGEVGVYLTDHDRGPKEPDILTVLQLATFGAVASQVVHRKDGDKVHDMVEAAPHSFPFPVPKQMTPLVRYILGKRFYGFISSSSGALHGRLVDEGIRLKRGNELADWQQQYIWTYDYLGIRPRQLPTQVTNRGFALQLPDLEYPTVDHSYDKLEGHSLYSASVRELQAAQVLALPSRMRYIGRYVPLGVSDGHMPTVTGPPVFTAGIRERDQYVPQVIVHGAHSENWEYLA